MLHKNKIIHMRWIATVLLMQTGIVIWLGFLLLLLLFLCVLLLLFCCYLKSLIRIQFYLFMIKDTLSSLIYWLFFTIILYNFELICIIWPFFLLLEFFIIRWDFFFVFLGGLLTCRSKAVCWNFRWTVSMNCIAVFSAVAV